MKIFPFLITGISVALTYYFGMPTLNFQFVDLFLFIAFNAIVFSISNWVSDNVFGDGYDEFSKLTISSFVIALIAILWLFVVPIFNTWGLFHASEYKNLLGEVKVEKVNTLMSPIDPQNIVIIDETTAHRLADKVLGSADIAIGSESYIGELTLQKVGDKLYYVAPLLHSGFFKWWSNGDRGTKGYVMVNATNDKDVKLVQEIDGKPISIVYQPEAFASQDLERHIYTNGYSTQGFADFSFEIDDNMKPYYVVTLYDKTIGFSGSEASGVLLVDVETGEIKKYSVENTPRWVDRIHPQNFVENQISYWGEFVHGWWNPSNKDRISPTEGISIVYGEDGECYFYTGITSYGRSDQSSIGFMLVNSRTKAVKFYKQAGATEQAAMASARGKVQEKGYDATFPRPYNVDGVWTYVMALKDKEGLIKMVGLVSVSNYEVVGIGTDVKSAIRDYKATLNSTGNVVATSNKGEAFSIKGVVLRIGDDIRSGNTYYYIQLKGHEDKIFVSSSSTSEELPLTINGDSILIEFDDAGNSYIDIKSFDNLNLNPQKTKAQENVEKYHKSIKKQLDEKEVEVNTNAVWDTLSPSKKQELLNSIKK